jgi:predicted dehydrogenase
MERRFGLPVMMCADIDNHRAAAAVEGFPHRLAVSVDDLLAAEGVDVVLNLTPPLVHAEISRRILESGKHIYSEKPLAADRDSAAALLALAASKSLSVGCAPDTFLGRALQTARSLIDRGAIGDPVAAAATMMCDGHEGWHPNPEFFYSYGGGPLFDMGPYHLTALVALLGPVKRVAGAQRTMRPERVVAAGPRKGSKIHVQVATHTAAVLEFALGPVVTLVASFDVAHARSPSIEIYGTSGTLTLPDPNGFGGKVLLRGRGVAELSEVNRTNKYTGNCRGLGAAEMCAAIMAGRPARASGSLAFHILDVMESIEESSREGRHVVLTSSCCRPEPFSDLEIR